MTPYIDIHYHIQCLYFSGSSFSMAHSRNLWWFSHLWFMRLWFNVTCYALMDLLHVIVACIYAEYFSIFTVKRSGKKAHCGCDSVCVCLSISTNVSLGLFGSVYTICLYFCSLTKVVQKVTHFFSWKEFSCWMKVLAAHIPVTVKLHLIDSLDSWVCEAVKAIICRLVKEAGGTLSSGSGGDWIPEG